MTDFRALCVELTDCLEKADWPHRYKAVFQQWTDIAHAALAESDGPAVSGDREPASVTTNPSEQLYVLFASLEWKLGCHMAEWKAARELAYRHCKAGDDLNQAHCDGVVRLLREHLEAYGQA